MHDRKSSKKLRKPLKASLPLIHNATHDSLRSSFAMYALIMSRRVKWNNNNTEIL